MPVVERLEASLQRIAELDHLNAFITVDGDGARRSAAQCDHRRSIGSSLGPLDGVLVAIKDNIDTAGLRTTSGTQVFSRRVPDTDADVVQRLRQAGAVIVGKTNMTELACGTIGTNEHWGDVAHPIDPLRYAGGSSSGSAVAVATGIVDFALGSDTSCSIRQPASTCGIVGLKPTFGRTSNAGVSVCTSWADHVGPMTRTAEEAATVLGCIQGDGWDDPAGLLGHDVAGIRVGVLGGEFAHDCAPDILSLFDDAVSELARLGAVPSAVALDIDLMHADDQLNLLCADLFAAYGSELLNAPQHHVGGELRGWLTLFDADPAPYAMAISHRSSLQQMLRETFAHFDVLVCPTTRRTAGLRAEAASEPRELRVANCSMFSFTGVPSITCLLYTSPSPRDATLSRMPSSA